MMNPLAFILCVALLSFVGCKSAPKEGPDIATTPSTMGPEYLRGTIGSLTKPQGFEPQFVGGFGLVVMKEPTGSADIPPYLEEWLINKMKQRGLGSVRMGTEAMSPQRVLNDARTAVVEVMGIIPPGATRGSRFDLYTRAVSGTQTTSLQGGVLWTTELSEAGLNRSMRFSRPLATGNGAVVVDMFERNKQDPTNPQVFSREREGVILSGGVVTTHRPIYLVLNQPSWSRSRAIEMRINNRFKPSMEDRNKVAIAKSDALVEINIPVRFRSDPARLLSLIQNTYLETGNGFEVTQAGRLAKSLSEAPLERAANVAFAWESLGKLALPEIRIYYDHTNPIIQLAALKAGAGLRDEVALPYLLKVTNSRDALMRTRAAQLLAFYPTSPEATRTLASLLYDKDRDVRIAVYEVLLAVDSPLVRSMDFGEGAEAKFRLDIVQSPKRGEALPPLVYISQVGVPRIAIFNADTSFKMPLLASLWNNRMMMRIEKNDDRMLVQYQSYGSREITQTHEIRPLLANLIFLMAHKSTLDRPTAGLDLTYSEVAEAIYRLRMNDKLDAEVEVQVSPLAADIERMREQGEPGLRPEFGDEPVVKDNPNEGDTTGENTGDDGPEPKEIPMPVPADGSAPAVPSDDESVIPMPAL